MKDKNGITIKDGQIALTHDRNGGVWIAPIHKQIIKWVRGDKIELVFDANYRTVLHDYCAKEYEIIGNEDDNLYLLLLNCNPFVYFFKRVVWEIKNEGWFNSEKPIRIHFIYKVKKFYARKKKGFQEKFKGNR